MRELALLDKWTRPPLGGVGDEERRLPRDLVYHQYIRLNNTGRLTGRRLPVDVSVAFRQRQGTYTYEEVPYGHVPLWTSPPTVLQIQLQETVDTPGRLRVHSRADRGPGDESASCWPITDEEGRWLPNRERPKTPTLGNWDRPSRRSRLFYNGQAVQPEQWDREGYYDPLVPQTLGQLRTREGYEPYSRGTDPNEHRTRRHKYDAGLPPPNRKLELVLYEKRGEDKTHEQTLRGLADDSTGFADDQRDVAKWKEHLAEAVQNPVFPTFCLGDIR
jgi:hypothetical protein